MDKIKDMASKATGSSGGSTGSSSGGSSNKMNDYVHKGIDQATDRAGMGDKYDSKINDQADKQIKNYQNKQ